MHITKENNGLYKVIIKKIGCQFYVDNYNEALKIAFKITGANDER